MMIVHPQVEREQSSDKIVRPKKLGIPFQAAKDGISNYWEAS